MQNSVNLKMKRPRSVGIYEESHKIPYINYVYSSLLFIIKVFKNNTKIHTLFFYLIYSYDYMYTCKKKFSTLFTCMYIDIYIM